MAVKTERERERERLNINLAWSRLKKMRITNEQDDDHQSQHSQLYNDVTPSTRTVIIIDCRAAATDDITRQMLQLQLLEM